MKIHQTNASSENWLPVTTTLKLETVTVSIAIVGSGYIGYDFVKMIFFKCKNFTDNFNVIYVFSYKFSQV